MAGEGHHTRSSIVLPSTIPFSDRPSEKRRITISARRFKTENPFKKLLHCYRIYVDLGKALIDRATIGIKGA